MELLRLGFDLLRSINIGKVTVFQIMSAQNTKNNRTFYLFLILQSDRVKFDGSTPKLSNLSRICISFQFVGSIFDHLIKLVWFYSHIIGLYDL